MKEITWLINFAFPFPAGCTPAQLLSILKQMAADWPGMPRFPWRVTRNIHKFLGSPPVNFHYLMIHRCLMGCAAHQVLNATFASRETVLAMILREKFEVIGMLRLLLIEAIHAETKRTGVPYIPDCSGPEDGHKHLTAEEIEKRRRDFQACIDGAIADFVRILELASVPGGLKGEFLGRKLRSWARGGDIPDEVTLPVLVERTSEGLVLHPCQEEMRKLLEAGKTLPKLVVEKARGTGAGVKGSGGKVNSNQSSVNSAGAGVKDSKGKVNGKQSAVTGEISAVQGSVAAPEQDESGVKKVKIVGGYNLICFADGFTIDLRKRAKCRAFLAFVMKRCLRLNDFAFQYEVVLHDYNEAHPDNSIHSDRLGYDLFKNVDGFERVFETIDQAKQEFLLLIRPP